MNEKGTHTRDATDAAKVARRGGLLGAEHGRQPMLEWEDDDTATQSSKAAVPAVAADMRIRDTVRDALNEEDAVDATHISVTVDAGEVTLTGTVPSLTMKHTAARLAHSCRGVRDVHNRLSAL